MARVDKTLFLSCSWQKVDIQVGKCSKCVTITPDDLTGVTYWLCFHIGTQTTLQMIVTEKKKIHILSGSTSKGHPCSFLERFPSMYTQTRALIKRHARKYLEGDISIAWPLAGRSPSLPFRIYTLINLSEIKKPDISLFKWISSFCGILRLIEGSVLCGIHQDNCRPVQHCSRLHVYLLQSP